MNIQRIEYFLVVAREKSLSQAAQKMFISHQALSRQIRQLETELDVKLFARSNTGLSLTPAGQELLRTFQPLVKKMNQEYENYQNRISQLKNNLKIGYFNGLSFSEIIHPYIMNLQEKAPDLNIDFEADDLSHLFDALDRDEVDVIITVNAAHDISPKYQCKLLLQSTVQVYVSKNHPLYKKSSITKEDLKEHALLVHSNRPTSGKDAFASDVEAAKRIKCKNYSTFKGYLNQGLGYALIGDASDENDSSWKAFPVPEGYHNHYNIEAISKRSSIHHDLFI